MFTRKLAGLCLVASSCTVLPVEDEDFTTPGTISIQSGNNQTAPVGTPFSEPLRVIVFTPDGLKCNACVVVWDLIPDGFSSGPLVVPTSGFGESAIQINSLGAAGTYTVTASLDNGAKASFSLVAR